MISSPTLCKVKAWLHKKFKSCTIQLPHRRGEEQWKDEWTVPDGWKHVEEIRPPVFFPPSPPSPSIPCNNPQDCSLYRVGSVLSPLSFLSIESPYSVPPESFPVASETFSWCCIQERIIFEDYIWLQQFQNTSLSNIAVTDDFSLRWHSWSQRMRNKQWEIFQKHPLLGKLTLPGIKGWATNKQWEIFQQQKNIHFWETYT